MQELAGPGTRSMTVQADKTAVLTLYGDLVPAKTGGYTLVLSPATILTAVGLGIRRRLV